MRLQSKRGRCALEARVVSIRRSRELRGRFSGAGIPRKPRMSDQRPSCITHRQLTTRPGSDRLPEAKPMRVFHGSPHDPALGTGRPSSRQPQSRHSSFHPSQIVLCHCSPLVTAPIGKTLASCARWACSMTKRVTAGLSLTGSVFGIAKRSSSPATAAAARWQSFPCTPHPARAGV